MLDSHTDVTTLIRGNKIWPDELSHDEIGDDHLYTGIDTPCAKIYSALPTKKKMDKIAYHFEKSCIPLARSYRW